MSDINQMVTEAIEQMPLKGKSGDEKKNFKMQYEKGGKAPLNAKAGDSDDKSEEGKVNEKADKSHSDGEAASNKLQKVLQKTS